ncbi:MAG: hypothetical protein CTY13_05935 [Methylobacter sp.]|nr:MAG: hypothetical protein CTY13_05935 [Methylobacter sp.]
MTADLVFKALITALWRHCIPKVMIVHSDRDSQYCSAAWQNFFSKRQLIFSMSKKVTVTKRPHSILRHDSPEILGKK